jgi:hypothetical protein
MFTINGEGVPGETWKSVCVILNSDDRAADVALPTGEWTISIDQNGASAVRSASGSVNLTQKAGLVLYQQ